MGKGQYLRNKDLAANSHTWAKLFQPFMMEVIR